MDFIFNGSGRQQEPSSGGGVTGYVGTAIGQLLSLPERWQTQQIPLYKKLAATTVLGYVIENEFMSRFTGEEQTNNTYGFVHLDDEDSGRLHAISRLQELHKKMLEGSRRS